MQEDADRMRRMHAVLVVGSGQSKTLAALEGVLEK